MVLEINLKLIFFLILIFFFLGNKLPCYIMINEYVLRKIIYLFKKNT